MEWRGYEPGAGRDEAHRILRVLLERVAVPYTIHPGDWDWWTFHTDPRFATAQLVAESAVAEVGLDQRTVAAFGVPAGEAIALGEHYFGDADFSIGYVSERDATRIGELIFHGFAPDGDPEPIFERPAAGGVDGAAQPDGFVLRGTRGEEEHGSRAAAARRAFSNTMDPVEHAQRYLRFVRSPAYDAERDLVAIAPDGRVASFAIYWPDTRVSLAQFEPVGTDPEFQRRGLSRAVIANALERLARDGIARARVTTGGSNIAAIACYESCGFEMIDRVSWWRRGGRSP
jgi:ribosomal protein S18 acetylase RimI-like enzyme